MRIAFREFRIAVDGHLRFACLVCCLGGVWIPFLWLLGLQYKELERGKYSWNL
jgi:hypothetical protein